MFVTFELKIHLLKLIFKLKIKSLMNFMFIGGIGTQELLRVVVVVLILFGGKKLPELMRGAGRGIREFKDAMNTATTIDEDKKPEEKKEEEK